VVPRVAFFKSLHTDISVALGLIANRQAIAGLTKFLSFAYTYHYLNWFLKTSELDFKLSFNGRNFVLVSIYVLSIGIYFYDYSAGLAATLFLSTLHVTLEFPLNLKTVRGVF
jgi:hypothetical protein